MITNHVNCMDFRMVIHSNRNKTNDCTYKKRGSKCTINSTFPPVRKFLSRKYIAQNEFIYPRTILLRHYHTIKWNIYRETECIVVDTFEYISFYCIKTRCCIQYIFYWYAFLYFYSNKGEILLWQKQDYLIYQKQKDHFS